MKRIFIILVIFFIFAGVGRFSAQWSSEKAGEGHNAISGDSRKPASEEVPGGDEPAMVHPEEQDAVFATSEEYRDEFLRLFYRRGYRGPGSPREKMEPHHLAMEAWAKSSPFEALAFVFANRHLHGECEEIVMRQAVRADAERAMELSIEEAKGANSPMALNLFGKVLAEENPDAALALANDIPPGGIYSGLLAAYFKALADADRQTQEAHLERVRPGLRDRVRRAMSLREIREISSRLDGEVDDIEGVARTVFADIAEFAKTADKDTADRLLRSELGKVSRELPPEKTISLLKESGYEVSQNSMLAILESMKGEYIGEAMTIVEGNSDLFENKYVREKILRRLAEDDALAYAKKFESEFSGGSPQYSSEDFIYGFKIIVHRDGRGAANLWATLQSEELRNAGARTFVDNLVFRRDFENAQEWVGQVSDETTRWNLSSEVTEKQIDHLTRHDVREYGAAREVAAQLEDEDFRAQQFDAVAFRESSYHARHKQDFEQAREVAATISDEPGRERMLDAIARLEEANETAGE